MNEERFKKCNWPFYILESIANEVGEYRTEVRKLVELMLPNICEGWVQQRGSIFDFGDQPESALSVVSKDLDMLNKAPIRFVHP